MGRRIAHEPFEFNLPTWLVDLIIDAAIFEGSLLGLLLAAKEFGDGQWVYFPGLLGVLGRAKMSLAQLVFLPFPLLSLPSDNP